MAERIGKIHLKLSATTSSKDKMEMYANIKEELFLRIIDISTMAKDFYNLLIIDASISELHRTKPLQFYDNTDISKIAHYIEYKLSEN